MNAGKAKRSPSNPAGLGSIWVITASTCFDKFHGRDGRCAGIQCFLARQDPCDLGMALCLADDCGVWKDAALTGETDVWAATFEALRSYTKRHPMLPVSRAWYDHGHDQIVMIHVT